MPSKKELADEILKVVWVHHAEVSENALARSLFRLFQSGCCDQTAVVLLLLVLVLRLSGLPCVV